MLVKIQNNEIDYCYNIVIDLHARISYADVETHLFIRTQLESQRRTHLQKQILRKSHVQRELALT